MLKFWPLLAAAVLLGAFGLTLRSYGSSRYNAGRLEAINASLATDNNALVIEIGRVADSFDWVKNGTKGLVTDAAPLADSTVSTFKYVCDNRKAHGMPCTPPVPAGKPN